jgi:F-type H+-transporting ATPase subunit a
MPLELSNCGANTAAWITRTADQTRGGDANLAVPASRSAFHSRTRWFKANMPMTDNLDVALAGVPGSNGARILPKLRNRWVSLLFILLLMGLSADLTLAVGAKSDGVSTTLAGTAKPGGPVANPEQEDDRLSQKAVEIGSVFGFPITNSMLVSWIAALGLIIFAQLATRKMEQVPSGAQNFLEWLVESLYDFLGGILGPQLVKRTFWYFATVFIFILSANWVGLIPGIGAVGWGHATPHGFKVDQPLFRGANADVNMTLAMALIFFACWIFWALRELGPIGFLKEQFAPKGESSGPLRIVMAVVFFAAGCLEVISILFRPISLSFRLYGNTLAGETMLETMANLVPGLGWLLPVPFYFLELLVGVVQALVFMLLTAVFTLLVCQHEEAATKAAG